MTADAFAQIVNARKISRDRWMGQCPAHPDRSPSLSIRQGDERTLVYCMAGCRTDAVLRALGLGLRDLFDGPPPSPEDLAAKAQQEAKHELAARARRRAHGNACDELLKWERIRDELGAKLARLADNDPTDTEMTRLFHVACGRVIDLETKELRLRPDGANARTARNKSRIPPAIDNAA